MSCYRNQRNDEDEEEMLKLQNRSVVVKENFTMNTKNVSLTVLAVVLVAGGVAGYLWWKKKNAKPAGDSLEFFFF